MAIDGTSGNDTLGGSPGNDTQNGLGGDDTLYGSPGDDLLNGGPGYDRANYGGSPGPVSVTMSNTTAGAGTAQDGYGGSDTFTGIERVVGSNFDDTLTAGSAAPADFSGGLGNDKLIGSTQSDFVYYGNATSAVFVNLKAGTATGGEGNDTLVSIEAVAGSRFSDSLTGTDGNDYFRGDGSIDQLEGGNDTIDGGLGMDNVSYRDDSNGVNVNLETGVGIDGRGGIDTLISIEILNGGGGNDTLIGSSVGNYIYGAAGNDSISAAGGDDTIASSVGVDTVDGGSGNADYLRLMGGSDDYEAEIKDASTIRIWNTTSGEDVTLSNVEYLEFANGEVLAVSQVRNYVAYENKAPSFTNFAPGAFLFDLPVDNFFGKTLVDGSGNLVLGGVALISENPLTYVSGIGRLDENGKPDYNFGIDGRVQAQFGGSYYMFDMALDADGKIVTVGTSPKSGGGLQWTVARFNTDGTLDGNFGDNGIRNIALASGSGATFDDTPRSVAIDGNGNILIGGYSSYASSDRFALDYALVRLTSDGDLDTTFGGDGIAQQLVNAGSDRMRSIHVTDDDRILTLGTNHFSPDANTTYASAMLVMYNSDGTIDETWGNQGSMSIPVTGVNITARALTIDADGRFVFAVAEETWPGVTSVLIYRLTSDGSLDNTFNGDESPGVVHLPVSGMPSNVAFDLAIDGEGRIVVVGQSSQFDEQAGIDKGTGWVVRLNEDGSFDTDFGDQGYFYPPFPDLNGAGSAFNDVTIDASGDIIVTGAYAHAGAMGDSLVLRIDSLTGELDTTFASANSVEKTVLAGAGGPAVNLLYGGGTIYDAEMTAHNDFGGSILSVSRQGTPNANDIFGADAGASFAGGVLTVSGVNIGTVTNTDGVLTMSFNGAATQQLVNAAMGAVTWSNASIAAGGQATFEWTFQDNNATNEAGGAQTATATSSVSVLAMQSGTSGNDTLISGNDTLNPGGDNVIYAGAGNDTVDGGSGADFIVGEAGNDLLKGGLGDDSIQGGTGADTVYGGEGDDVLDGGAVTDRVNYTDGNWLSYLDATSGVQIDLTNITGDGSSGWGIVHDGSGTIDKVVNFPFIQGSDHDDRIIGSGAAIFEMFEGGKGDDTIDGGANAASTGNRAIYNNATGSVNVDLGANGIGSGIATGADGNDVLLNITQVRGSSYDDVLTGSNRTDTSETFDARDGADIIDGKGGFDIVRFEAGGMTTGVVADLSQGKALNDGFGNVDTLSNIEALFGSNGNDSLTGSGNTGTTEAFRGGAGNDTLDGKGGSDRAEYGTSGLGITVNLADSGDSFVSDGIETAEGSQGTDTLRNIEHILGGGGNDTINGNSFNNSLDGAAGNDSIAGGDGNDTIVGGLGDDFLVGNTGTDSLTGGAGNDFIVGNEGRDTLRGGAGDDTMDGGAVTDRAGNSDANAITYSDSTAGISMNLSGIVGDGETIGAGVVYDGWGGKDTVSRVQDITGSNFNDSILGSSAMIFEQFEGLAGDDTIDGGAITDGFNLVNSNRINYNNAGGSVTVDLGAGTASGAAGNDVLKNINQVRGSNFNDTIYGSNTPGSFSELFEGRAGNDFIDGRGGFDILRYDGAASTGIVFDMTKGTSTDGQGGTDTFTNIEGVYAGSGDDKLIGGLAANGVSVTDGLSEIFRGGAGNDTIDGGQGYDRADYTSSTTGAVVTLGGTVNGTAQDGLGGTDTLISIEAVRGSEFDDTLTGSDTGAYESFEGKAGNDIINGKGGTDRVDYRSSNVGVSVNLTNATTTVADGWGTTDTLTSIEDVRGSLSGNDTIVGSAVANVLEGLGGNDSISGAAGADTINAGPGVDTVDGGTESDLLVLQSKIGSYTVTGTLAEARLVNGVTGEDVTVRNVENFKFSDGTLTLAQVLATAGGDQGQNGDDGPNTLIGGAGNDNLDGKGGPDSIVGNDGDDFLTGGLGNDTIHGGNGWDTANYSDLTGTTQGVIVNLVTGAATGGAGTDSLTGIEAVEGSQNNDSITGSAQNNYLAGNGGNDTINGGDGDDHVRGGLGNDSLIGGNGNDAVDYTDATGSVTVNLATGSATGAAGTDVISGFERVYTGGGNDLITGDAKDNQFNGGAGDDTINGGLGWDSASYWDATSAVFANLGTGIVTGGAGTDSLSGIEQVDGSIHNDSLKGDANSNSFNGGLGDDTINGGDTIVGVSDSSDMVGYWDASGSVIVDLANGTASGAAGNDVLMNIENVSGSWFNDTIYGDAGNNYIEGNGGADYIDGGAGNRDTVSYQSAAGGVSVNLANGQVTGADSDTLVGIENVNGSSGNDTIVGDAGNNTLNGGLGNDSLDGGAGASDQVGYWDATAGVNVNLGTGAVSGGAGADTITGFEQVRGSASNDTLTGSNANTLTGATGNDSIWGHAGNDSIDGGSGNDYLVGGAGVDTMAGGAGIDRADLGEGATSGVTVTLNNGAATVAGGSGADILSGIEYISGTAFKDVINGDANDNNFSGGDGDDSLTGNAGNDSLFGDAGNDTLMGGAGADFLRGGAGNDSIDGGVVTDRVNYSDGNSLSYADSTNGVNLNLSGITGTGSTGTGVVSQDGFGGSDIVSNVQFITTGSGNDTIVGSQARQFEQFDGGLGDDTIDGGAILDTVNSVDSNRANYQNATGSVTVDLQYTSIDNGRATGAAGTDTLLHINQVRGGNSNDNLLGSDRTDISEQFEGRGGDDYINGRGGFDVVRYDTSLLGVNVNIATGVVSGDMGSDTLAGIEGAFGGNGNDTLTGGKAANGTDADFFDGKQEIFRGGAGSDTIDGGQGYDVVFYTSNSALNGNKGVSVQLGGAGAGSASDGLFTFDSEGKQTTSFGTDTLISIEGVRGSDFNDTLMGSDGAFESFEGMGGADIIDGKGGLDRVDYSKSTGAVTINLTVTTGNNVTADGWGSSDSIKNIEWIRASNNNDSITGTSAAERFDGLAGNDTINAGLGNDTIYAGTGADSINGGDATDSDTLVLLGAWGDGKQYTVGRPSTTDTSLVTLVNGSTGETITARGIETFVFTDVTLALGEMFGNALDDFDNNYTGNDDPNPINGLGGNDKLFGLGGNDTINGGTGIDEMTGGQGDDSYVVDNVNDTIVELDGEGYDDVTYTVAGTFNMNAKAEWVEKATAAAGTALIHIVGNAQDNLLIGNGAANSLTGGAGNDTLDGGAGTDFLFGGTGNDTYIIDVATEVANETAGGGDGYDTVQLKFASGTYTLADGIEVGMVFDPLTTGAVNINGNKLANELYGNAGNNSLSGGDGNDFIEGGAGNDTILGGADDDVLGGGAGNDSIDGGAITDKQNYKDGNTVSYNYEGVTAGVNANLGTGVVSQDGLGGADTVKNVTFFFGTELGDTIVGSSGGLWEQFDGLGGDDYIDGGVIKNYFVDSNRVSYTNATSFVTVDLIAGTAIGGGGNDTLVNINQVRGSKHDDFLYGSDRDDMPEVFEGREGNNTIDGRGGFDYVSYLAAAGTGDSGLEGVVVNLGAGTGVGADWNDSFSHIEGVWGSHYDDTLVGSDGDDVFRGNGGFDSIDGGAGTGDMLDYGTSGRIITGVNAGVNVNLKTGTALDGWWYTPTNQGTDTFINIEGVRGSDFNDTLTGSEAWFEFFDGRGGNDTIDGGGGGGDRVQYNGATSGVNVNLATGIATDGLGGTDKLIAISDVLGSRFNDTIVGSGFIDYLMGWDGNDNISAGAGNDTIEAGTATGTGALADTVDGGADVDTLALLGDYGDGKAYLVSQTANDAVTITNAVTKENIAVKAVEWFQFTDVKVSFNDLLSTSLDSFNNNYTGNDDPNLIDGKGGDDILNGLGGNDTIIGGSGTDKMDGGAGDDSYQVDNAGDSITDSSGTDTAEIAFGVAGTFNMLTQAPDVETANVVGTLAVHVIGNTLDNKITGNSASQSLSGGEGNDTLIGGVGTTTGTDTLIGGAGNDTFEIDSTADVIIETSDKGSGIDEVRLLFAAAGTYTIAANVENATIANNTLVTINGNELDNTITGNDGNNILNGGKGNDTFNAGKATGNGDTIDGGEGDDTVVLAAASNAFTYAGRLAPSGDTKLTTTSGEIVVLKNVEYVRFSDDVTLSMGEIWGNTATDFADSITGTGVGEALDGKGGNDTIVGLEGNDTLVAGPNVTGQNTDLDKLVGGLGDDTYIVNTAGDLIVENDGEGTDSVTVTFAALGTYNMFTNAKFVENATAAAGTIAINIVGNEGANRLTGNNAANSLTGGEGNDTLVGNGGTDTLVGGAGDDTYYIDATTDIVNETGGTGLDTVYVMLPGTGTYTLTAGVEYGIIGEGTNAVNLTGNVGDNKLVGNAGNNVLNGGTGGNDTFIGGGGTDVIDGGGAIADSDTLVLEGSASDWLITRPSDTQTVFSKLGSKLTVSNVELVQFDVGGTVAIGSLLQQIGSPGPNNLVGGSGNDTFDGAAGADIIDGKGGDDTLFGGADADTLIGGAGTDYLDGGAGNDTYRWTFGDGDDLIVQNDTVSTSTDVLQLQGVSGDQVSFSRGGFTYNDLIVTVRQGEDDAAVYENITVVDYFNSDLVAGVNPGTIDTVVATGSATTFDRTAIKSQINEGNGNDVYVFFEGNESTAGSEGNDWILMAAGNDTVIGSVGADSVFGGTGNDVLAGGDDDDLLVGGAGADTLAGGAGDDVLSGGAGSDVYEYAVAGGWDVISERLDVNADSLSSGIGPVYMAGDGDQPASADVDTLVFKEGIAESDVRATRSGDSLVLTVNGSGGVVINNWFTNGVLPIERVQFSSSATWNATQIRAKVLVPTEDDDQITGYLAGEKLFGLLGDDIIDGREGNDTINGGAGSDTLTGGKGNDRFVLDVNDGGVDTITDFASGDIIAISKSAFASMGLVGNVGERIDVSSSAIFSYDSGSGALELNGNLVAIIGSLPGALGQEILIIA